MFLTLNADVQLLYKKKKFYFFLDPSANVNYIITHFHYFQFLATHTNIYQIFSLMTGSMFYWGHILSPLFTVTGYILHVYFTCIELDILRSKMVFNERMPEHVSKCSCNWTFGHGLRENIFREMLNNHVTYILHCFSYLRCRTFFWVRVVN